MTRSLPRARWIALSTIVVLSFISGGWLLRPAPSPDGGTSTSRPASSRTSSPQSTTTTSTRWVRATSIRPPRPPWSARCSDPYAELLISEDYREYQRQMSGTEVDCRPQRGPPSRASIARRGDFFRPGDEVLSIDGQSTRGWSAKRLEEALRGAGDRSSPSSCGLKGSDRPGGAAAHPDRGPCPGRVVRACCSAADVGYVVLRRMSEGAAGGAPPGGGSARGATG